MSGGENGTIVDSTDLLGAALDRASEESSVENLTEFYELLIGVTLFVPERTQELPLSRQPAYPNDFLNILGVQNKDTVVVPVFSSEDAAREWSGQELRLRAIKLAELLDLLPNGWLLILNPGSECEKDITSWEIELLKGGTASIPALVDELLVEDVIRDVEMEALPAEQYRDLKAALTTLAEETPEVQKLFLLKESGKTLSERDVTSLILGILIAEEGVSKRSEIQERFSDAGALVMIGAEKLKVRCGDSIGGNLMLGIFEGYEPFYQRPRKGSWVSRLFNKSSS